MPDLPGKIQNMDDGDAEALQALLRSLTPKAAVEGGGKLSPAAVRKLSEKLTDLVGEDAGETQIRNEQGQLLNEQGLPIINIAEPIQTSDMSAGNSPFPEDEAPLPSQHLRYQNKNAENEEERMEQAEGEALSMEKRQEILRKRKQAAQDEIARLKAAKDMQKKMGKALLRSMSTASKPSTSPSLAQSSSAEPSADVAEGPRKTVKFADTESDDGQESESQPDQTPDWGDVVPARLRANHGRTLMSKAQADTHPMKMQVVERIPGKPKPEEPQPDSDDESEPPSSPLSGSDDGELILDGEFEEEVDLDFAHHQREIALEYHEKRAKMADATSNAMRSHSHNQDGSVYKTAEDSLNQTSRKPIMSHFQANRLASSYNASTPSTSKLLGANVLPASSARTLQHAIRTGKLDSDNRLVGGDAGESGSEDDESPAMQEILELLKKGELYNLGPDGNLIYTVPPPSNPSQNSSAPPDVPPPSASRKPTASKFKLNRPSGQRPPAATPSSPEPSGSTTPLSNVARSSPKLPSPPTVESPPLELSSSRTHLLSSTVVEKSTSYPSKAGNTPSVPMVIDSPSFPASRQPTQPPTIVRAAESDSSKPTKVSRFLAERI
ncbi:hypothetical protein B0H10DRAFT_1943141 [Mycena sp. CBHHK59/15]|nr:hypothetical protein B0H10DRAFT_1943141 [Mycena sp. CBHHK59/15]